MSAWVSRSPGISEYLDACVYRQRFVADQIARLEQQRNEFRQDCERLEALLDRTRHEMVGYLLPEVDDPALIALEEQLSYPGLIPIKRDYETQLARVQDRREELEAMDEIKWYELKLDEATKAINEIRPGYEQYRHRLNGWLSSKWFQQLDERGYFDHEYTPTLINRFFDWRAVSFLMSEFEKEAELHLPTPREVRIYYRKLRGETEPVFKAYAQRMRERKELEALKDEYDNVLQAPQRLLAELYRDLGKAILDHLQACPEQLRLQLADSDRNLKTFLKKEAGVTKQIQYLRELSVTRIDARTQNLYQELRKLEGKIEKLEWKRRRGKRKYYSESDIQRMRTVKAEKWNKRQTKLRDLRTRIVSFDRYDSGSFAQDYLWWELLTHRARGDDIYEVRQFYERHPGWDYRRYHEPGATVSQPEERAMDGAAEALASSMMTPDDGFQSLDVS